MKFGKRLLREASRTRWAASYIDYKQLKHAIKQDVAAKDARGSRFEAVLRLELQKVAAFYVEKEEELAAAVAGLAHSAHSAAALSALRSEIQDLRKYAVLNYYAVVKAAKKRNRHLRAACGGAAVPPLRAVAVLSQQRFFTSPTLAALATQAEILEQELAPQRPAAEELLAEYRCPICLDLLRSPVLLTCAHRYCWACLLAHCAAAARGGGDGHPGAKPGAAKGAALAEAALQGGTSASATQQQEQQHGQAVQQEQQQPPLAMQQGQEAALDAADEDAAEECATFDCAVCRRAQLLNLDRLQVDPHLDAFLQKLERQQLRDVKNVAAAAAPQPGSSKAKAASAPIPIGRSSAAAAAAAEAAEAEAMAVDVRAPGTSLAAASELLDSSLAAATDEEEEEEEEEAASQGRSVQPAAAAAASTQQQEEQEERQQGGQQGAGYRCVQPEVVLVAPPDSPFAGGAPPLLPPQRAEHAGRLVVCLDLDGTLVTTFTPKRAPLLPPSAVSYVVGRGGKLNPGGVFVVERPGLGEFLQRVAAFAEVVLFTAGLEDYAAPICDAIEARYPGAFHHRLYRPATVAEDVYPCIKDLSRLGRDLSRCVLVDDTPLAFFRQPDHGVPVLQFRGDVDDRMLPEAVAPLLESLAGCGDVAAPLARRFNMHKWFAAQGLAPPPRAAGGAHRNASMPALAAAARPALSAPLGAALPQPPADACAAEVLRQSPYTGTLLVCDFDRTLIDYDAGERLCDELAPELTSLLSSLQMPANFVPVTNTVLSEMQRRGVSRDRLVSCLREMGREVPLATQRMLQWAARRGIETVVLSDCNSVFIGHILTGARLNTLVRRIITNPAAFERAPAAAPASAAPGGEEVEEPQTPRASRAASSSAFGSGWSFFRSSSSSSLASMSSGGSSGGGSGKPPSGVSHRLVVAPRHNAAASGPHACPLCPANLCKGAELAALRAAAAPGRAHKVVYCGDGANDLCPALRLGPNDVLLARAGHSLERLVAERSAAAAAAAGGGGGASVRPVAAQVFTWRTHEELCRLVQQHAA